eukprot:SAG22_NODE_28_length_28728_cov_19.603619_18_plen_72_part_00
MVGGKNLGSDEISEDKEFQRVILILGQSDKTRGEPYDVNHMVPPLVLSKVAEGLGSAEVDQRPDDSAAFVL